jgi:hypothetical protein
MLEIISHRIDSICIRVNRVDANLGNAIYEMHKYRAGVLKKDVFEYGIESLKWQRKI